MHPDLYLRGVMPEKVELPRMNGIVPRGWKKLDENVIGEFGMNQIFKQFLGKARADELAAPGAAIATPLRSSRRKDPRMLVIRMRLAGEAEAARFFDGYSELLDKKHSASASAARQASSLFIETPGGGAFIRCVARDCLFGEGATRAQFDAMTHATALAAAARRCHAHAWPARCRRVSGHPRPRPNGFVVPTPRSAISSAA